MQMYLLRYKAWLVAKNFTRTYEIDYIETFVGYQTQYHQSEYYSH